MHLVWCFAHGGSLTEGKDVLDERNWMMSLSSGVSLVYGEIGAVRENISWRERGSCGSGDRVTEL